MAKKSNLEKLSVRLVDGDAAKINELFPTHGYNKVIRMLVSNFLRKISTEQTSGTAVEINLTERELQRLED